MVVSSDPIITFRRVPEHAGIHRDTLETFAAVLRKRVAGGRSFHCLLAGDTELRRLNSLYLGRDYATDVLSFPAEPLPSGTGSLGDIAISRQRATAQAAEIGHTVTEEIQLLMLHGVLHLLGMDHDRDRGAMARAEKAWRSKFKLPSSLTERAAS